MQLDWRVYHFPQETKLMKYLLLMYASESQAPPPEEIQADVPAWHALLKQTKEAGVLVSTNGIAPGATATTVRMREGKTLITDGPFAETHEQLGGYFLLDCQDLDEAIRWAEKIPTVKYGSIEIRPLWSPGS
jgi:hypothetical protein